MSTQFRAFRPLALTQNVTPEGLGAVELTLNYTLGTRAIRLCNVGTQTIFVRFKTTTGTAGVLITNSIPIPAGQTEIFTIDADVITLVAVSSAAGSILYSTIGEGI